MIFFPLWRLEVSPTSTHLKYMQQTLNRPVFQQAQFYVIFCLRSAKVGWCFFGYWSNCFLAKFPPLILSTCGFYPPRRRGRASLWRTLGFLWIKGTHRLDEDICMLWSHRRKLCYNRVVRMPKTHVGLCMCNLEKLSTLNS